MVLRRVVLLFICLLAFFFAIPSAEARKVALVIGNAAYPEDGLRNPINDARLIERTLRPLGFEVRRLENASFKQMQKAIREFGSTAESADVALFYFAGHGMQQDGENWLIPVDAQIDKPADVAGESIATSVLLRQIEDAKATVSLIILDACRNNPFGRRFRSKDRGLTRVDAPRGSIVAFAAQSGAVADDGNAGNGLYTKHLSEYLGQKGIEIKKVFELTAIAVERESGGKQRPREDVGLRGDFFLAANFSSENASVSGVNRNEIVKPLAAHKMLDEWPVSKPIRLVSVFPSGGSVDQVARTLASALQSRLKHAVIVENIGGASGMVGTDAVAKADPDGYTFGVVFDTHAVNPSLKEKIPFDTRKDIAYVTMLGTAPMVLVAAKNAGISSFKQLIDQAKAQRPTTYGSVGAGSLGHLAMALLAKNSGFDWTHVPYKGGSPLMRDAVAGHIPLSIGSMFLMKTHADAGNVVPLAVTTVSRSRAMPNVPTIAESGYPGFEAPAWWGVIAPAKTPQAIIDRMHHEISAALRSKEISEKFEQQGVDILGLGPDKFREFNERQMFVFGDFARDNGIRN